jgi:hypothetical protein
LLSSLTVMPEKAAVYRSEGLIDDLLTVEGDERLTVLRVAEHLTVVLLRPELAVQRKTQECLSLLEAEGFHPVRCVPVAVEPLCRQMWRYQWNAATDGLLHLAQRLYSAHTCLATVLWTPRRSRIPATVRLAEVKGPADPVGRAAHTLRSRLGSPQKLLALVHSPDEPLDLLREVALLSRHNDAFTEPLAAVLADPTGGPAAAGVRRIAAEWESGVKPQSLDPGPRLSTVRGLVESSRGDSGTVEAALRTITEMRTGSRVEWLGFLERLAALGIVLEPWDDIVLGASYAQINRGVPKLLGSPPPDGWSTRDEWR